MIRTLPEAIHLGADDIPSVATPDGFELQLVYANPRDSVWVARGKFPPGFRTARHQHTGQVFQYTVSGEWRYLEHDFIVKPGSFLYEPAGAAHTQVVLEENTGITDTWSHVAGANLIFDEDGEFDYVVDANSMIAFYFNACEEAGEPRPNIVAG